MTPRQYLQKLMMPLVAADTSFLYDGLSYELPWKQNGESPVDSAFTRAFATHQAENPLMSRPLVLVVEDHLPTQRTLVEILHWEDIDTVTAGSGKEALNLLRKQRPDLVILDMELPGGMRGIDVLRCIRADPRLSTTPVVLHTAEPGVMSLIEAEAADLVLLKPVSPDDLLTLVQRLLN